ncbi:hypothetical protein LTT66_12040 [Nocardia gipuzkoensis]|uniref:hypothetical protein n=1 Tax=Nocardia TaxID=1817 RepID=UPI001E2E02B2|nr:MULTISPECIES: hypothetical protein [Nocardia]UGT70831.1 hypothetical protein LTT66_12040 [Nocardia gipuzkoensis]
MTHPQPGIRSGDIPPEHATLLRRIHQLAADANELRATLLTTDTEAAATTAVFEQIAAVDRQRSLAEIQARNRGVPADWIGVVRRLAESGRAWNDDHLLPAPRPAPGRRNTPRVADDMRQLTDMAALTVARDHLLGINTADAEPDPAAAQQLRRNMEALWTRADRTATSIGLGARSRARAFNTTTDLAERVEGYLRYSREDLDIHWRSYTSTAIADGVRRSLKSLRRIDRDITTVDPDAEQPPTPKALIEQARHALDTAIRGQSEAGAQINAAVDAAIPEAATDSWDSTTGVDAGETAAVAAYPDTGPDP